MQRRVRFHADFRTDLRSQLSWLKEHRDGAWVQRLRIGIEEATSLLATFPDIGTIEATDGAFVLRRFILGKLPFTIWFLRDASDPNADVWLLRLFHAKQERPIPVIPSARKR